MEAITSKARSFVSFVWRIRPETALIILTIHVTVSCINLAAQSHMSQTPNTIFPISGLNSIQMQLAAEVSVIFT